MAADELPPDGKSELRPKGRGPLDRATVYGILSVAVAPVLTAIGVWVYGYTSLGGDGELWMGDPRWSAQLENLLYLSLFGGGLLGLVAVLLAVLGIATGREQGSRPGCLLSVAGLGLTIIAGLVYLGVCFLFMMEQMY